MQDYELDAYLGGTAVTDEQRQAIMRASDAIEARWPDPEMYDAREAAFTKAVQVILGDATLEQIGVVWRDLRSRERIAHAELTGALIAARPAFCSEQALADRAGVTRLTVRKALGKNHPRRLAMNIVLRNQEPNRAVNGWSADVLDSASREFVGRVTASRLDGAQLVVVSGPGRDRKEMTRPENEAASDSEILAFVREAFAS